MDPLYLYYICLSTDKASILQHFKTKKSGAACDGHILPILPGVYWDQQHLVLCACHISSHRIRCGCLSILGCHHRWLLVALHVCLNCHCGSMGSKNTPSPGRHSDVHLSGMEHIIPCKKLNITIFFNELFVNLRLLKENMENAFFM